MSQTWRGFVKIRLALGGVCVINHFLITFIQLTSVGLKVGMMLPILLLKLFIRIQKSMTNLTSNLIKYIISQYIYGEKNQMEIKIYFEITKIRVLIWIFVNFQLCLLCEFIGFFTHIQNNIREHEKIHHFTFF